MKVRTGLLAPGVLILSLLSAQGAEVARPEYPRPDLDLFTVHDYSPQGPILEKRYMQFPEKYDRAGQRALLVEGARYHGTPLVISEFGGIAYRMPGTGGRADDWGYSGIEPSEAAFLSRFESLVKSLRNIPAVAGYCYTQLPDVEQEINGLLTYDRKSKVGPEKIRKLQ